MAGPLDPGPGITVDPAFDRFMCWAYGAMAAIAAVMFPPLIVHSALGLTACP